MSTTTTSVTRCWSKKLNLVTTTLTMKRENKYCKPSVKKRNGGRGDEKYEALKKKTSFTEAEAFPESCEHPRQPEYEPGGRRDDHNGG